MMQFPGRVGDFFQRHRKKFIFAGVLVGGVVGSVKFAQYKVKQWMSEQEHKYLGELRKQQHFGKTQEHCFAIAEAVVKALKEDIVAAADAEAITDALKVEKSPEKKLELWNELKVAVFAKVTSCLYVLTLSVVIIRLQLNHLAAKVFSNSLKSQEQSIDDATQRWFLSLSHRFLSKNSLNFMVTEIRKISRDLTESMPLQCRIRGADVESMLKSVHDRIKRHQRLQFSKKDADDSSVLDFLVPAQADAILESDENIEVKKALVDELWDILDCEDSMAVFDSCMLKSFQIFCRSLDGSISEVTSGTKLATDAIALPGHGDSQCLPLAKVLPILNSQVDTIISENFIRKTLANELLTKFSSNIYESFTEKVSQ